MIKRNNYLIILPIHTGSPIKTDVGLNLRTFSVSSYPGQTARVRFSQKGRKGLEDNSKSFSALIERALLRFNGMVSRNGGRPLIGFLIKNIAGVGGRLSRSRCAMIVLFVKKCHHLHKSEGMKGLVLYLKTSYVLIQQAVAGYIVEDLTPLKRRVRRDRSGFPLWIPRLQRSMMRRKDIRTIRFWTTLVSIYRVLSFPSRVSVSSIIDPGVDGITNMGIGPFRESFEQALMLFGHKVDGKNLKSELKPLDFFAILKASPLTGYAWRPDLSTELKNAPKQGPTTREEMMVLPERPKYARVPIVSTNPGIINEAAFTIMSDDNLRDDMMMYASDQEGFFEFFSNMKRCSMMADPPLSHVGTPYTSASKVSLLGKLGLKDEPAGKVRVFAMVDCGTQGLLFPLHKLLQKALRVINEDATFDQIGVVEKKLDQLARKYKRGKAFSFDLSSATDRLPIGLQVSILTPLLGNYPSKAWASILTSRSYSLPKRARDDTGFSAVKYAVGQPMGGYSSWVMLAVTHHVVVQGAAYLVGKVGWKRGFEDYVILGDDIVIFDTLVANAYFDIMTRILGVSIGLAKSIKSYNGMILEFAKKFWVNGKRCFVVPIRDCIVSTLSTDTMNEFMIKHGCSLNDYLKMRGLGYKSRSKYRANLGTMPTRLRVFIVIWAYYNKDFMFWATMKNLSETGTFTRKGIEEFIYTLADMRRELADRLERRKSPTMSDFEKLSRFPFYSATSALQEMVEIGEYNRLVNIYRIKDVPTLSYYDVDDLRILLGEILEDITKLEEAMENLPENSGLRFRREDERPFNSISDLYRKWCRLQDCMRKHVHSETVREDSHQDVETSSTEASIWVAHHITDTFWEGSYPTTRDFGIGNTVLIVKNLTEGVKGWVQFLAPGMVVAGYYGGLPDISQTSLGSIPDSLDVGDDLKPSPPPSSELLNVGLSILLGGFGLMVILYLLVWLVTPLDEGQSLADLFVEMMSYRGEPEVILNVDPPEVTEFRFPRLSELVEGRRSQMVPSVETRSPQLGHGGSEPGSFNEDGPEQGR